jgi:hypothetical protein
MLSKYCFIASPPTAWHAAKAARSGNLPLSPSIRTGFRRIDTAAPPPAEKSHQSQYSLTNVYRDKVTELAKLVRRAEAGQEPPRPSATSRAIVLTPKGEGYNSNRAAFNLAAMLKAVKARKTDAPVASRRNQGD